MGARLGRALVMENGVELAQVQFLQRRGVRVVNDGPVWLQDISADRQRRVLRKLCPPSGCDHCHAGLFAGGVGIGAAYHAAKPCGLAD